MNRRSMLINPALLILLLNQIISLLFYFADSLSTKAYTYYGAVTIILIAWSVIKTDKRRLSYSSALLCYITATQFGLVIPYVFIGMDALANYSSYTLRFLDSEYFPKAIGLGVIAVNAFEVGVLLSRKKYGNVFLARKETDYGNGGDKRPQVVGTMLLILVLFFFLANIATGRMLLFSTYEQFMQSKFYGSSLYSYILILFYVGMIYLASAGNIRENWKSWTVWVLIVVIFAANGNKGEFMYALLAVFGMLGVKGKKVSGKTIFVLFCLLFIAIPSITRLRSIGIVGNLSSLGFNPIEAFTEMGMQIRTSVYTLEGLAAGSIHSLSGMSYIQPVINMLTPFLPHTQATADIRDMFWGYGYSQVIESYLNFNLAGVLAFFGITGYLLGKYEALANTRNKVAYLGTVTCIMINASRNYFAFVPGQLVIVTIIYVFTMRIKYVWKK